MKRSSISSQIFQFGGRIVMPLVLAVVGGCAAAERTRPISNTFLEDRDVTVEDDLLPFNHAWIDPKVPRNYYSKVFFRSVSADRLPKDSWTASTSIFITSAEDYQKEAKELASYFKEQLNKKVSEYHDGTVAVVSKPEANGLVFDIALTELEFTHPISKAAVMAVPVPGSSVVFSAVSEPHVAFAARVYDGKSGKLLATVADRRYPPTRLIDVNKLTVTSSNREIVSTWSEIIAEGLNRDRFAKVSNRGIFSILPW